MIEIYLSHGKVALIDDCDAHLAAVKWYAKKGRSTWYARSNGRKGGRRLHRAVLGITDPSVEVDHINGNGLDCRRHNLRAATTRQNQGNARRRRDNATGFKGVSHDQGRWRALIRAGGTQRHLGQFATPEAAALAYDEAAREAFGPFARLNFPREHERAA